MAHTELSRIEEYSLNDAGEAAGAYLESIGKFSVDQLSPIEWSTFLKKVLTTYGEKMRERVENHIAPF